MYRGNLPGQNKDYGGKAHANTLTVENQVFPWVSEHRKDTRSPHPLLQLLFNIVLEAIAETISKEKKRHANWIGKMKQSVLAGDMILCIETPKTSFKNFC